MRVEADKDEPCYEKAQTSGRSRYFGIFPYATSDALKPRFRFEPATTLSSQHRGNLYRPAQVWPRCHAAVAAPDQDTE